MARGYVTVEKGITERDGHSFMVRVRRKDGAGVSHSITQTFAYLPKVPASDPHSRSSMLAKARAFVTKEREALRVEKRPAPTILKEQTLRKWMAEYVETVSPTKKTREHEASWAANLSDWFPALVDAPVSALRASDFVGALEHSVEARMKASGYKPNSIKRYLQFVSTVFSHFIKKKHYAIPHPLRDQELPSENDSRDRLITDAEYQEVLARMALDGVSEQVRASIAFLRYSAARRSEAVKLGWKDINWAKSPPTAFLHDTKTPNKAKSGVVSRTIPLDARAVAAIQTLVVDGKPPTKGQVFGVRPDSLTQAWVRACKRVGVKDARLHDLRHTRLTELAGLGLSMLQLSAISGHKDMRMLKRYYHEDAESLGQTIEKAQRDKELEAEIRAEILKRKAKEAAAKKKPVAKRRRKSSPTTEQGLP